MMRFENRREAGHMLAESLSAYANRTDVVVLALPRGGVPVGFEVARALNAPLDVFVVRKLGTPGQEELAMGAIASGGVRVLNDEVIRSFGITDLQIDRVAIREQWELERRELAYRGNRPLPDLLNRTVIIVDDGLATGTTMRAAVAALRSYNPARTVVAVPAAPADICDELRAEVDEVFCLITPEVFWAVGAWYEDFSQTTDAEVHVLLERTFLGMAA